MRTGYEIFLLGAVISLMVTHHLSLAPLAILMVYRRYKEYKFSVGLNLGLMLGGLLSFVLSFRSSQTTMNPWFDGSDPIAFWQHITAKVYQAAFLDLGIHIDAGRNFLFCLALRNLGHNNLNIVSPC